MRATVRSKVNTQNGGAADSVLGYHLDDSIGQLRLDSDWVNRRTAIE